MDDMILVHSADVCHHGVKGQSWGKRQYQYEDGSLTPLGREHYGVSKKDFSKKEQKQYLGKNGKLNAAGREHYTKMRDEARAKIREHNYKESKKGIFDEYNRVSKASRIGFAAGLATSKDKNPWKGYYTGRNIGILSNITSNTIGKWKVKSNQKKIDKANKILKAFGDTKASDVTKKKVTGGK